MNTSGTNAPAIVISIVLLVTALLIATLFYRYGSCLRRGGKAFIRHARLAIPTT
jgi:hypothetical protein